jgi:hypothetical protein
MMHGPMNVKCELYTSVAVNRRIVGIWHMNESGDRYREGGTVH